MEKFPNIIRKRAIIARNLAESANKNDDLKDLYVFGYQCKLFRDDERATFIDQGKHLIPWMDDDRLMIDRYDGRGHLHDLTEYDGELCRSSVEPLTEEERHIEALCDEERYLELNSEYLEKMLYEEEELKRLNEALAADGSYTAVGFSYDDPDGLNTESDAQNNTEEEDEDSRPYIPIPELQLPPSIKPPLTAKMHAIIERTAIFIAKHGVQMEIMMKTKQKDNPQFGFLNYEDELNAYYKFVVNAIKHKKYIPASVAAESENKSEHAYLHPSLASSSALAEATPEVEKQPSRQEFLESISSKLPAGQIANTPYAKLLSNLSRHTQNTVTRPVDPASNGDLGQTGASLPSIRSAPSSLQHLGTQQSQANNASANQRYKGISQPPVPGLEPVSLPASSSLASAVAANYIENEADTHGMVINPPPPDVQPIIDKMADYVARNGPEFEIVVRRRNDARFTFIEPNHQHHAYYLYKKNLFIAEIEQKKAMDEEERLAKEQREKDEKERQERDAEAGRLKAASLERAEKARMESTTAKDNKLQIKGVSFSIKAKEEETPMLMATALPYESSDEDDDTDGESDSSQANSVPFSAASKAPAPVSQPPVPTLRPAGGSSSRLSAYGTASGAPTKTSTSDIPIPLPTEPSKADQLARDKLSAAYREKHLQAQRKDRAAAFLTTIKKTDVLAPASSLPKTEDTDYPSVDVQFSPASLPVERSRSSTPATVSAPTPISACSSPSNVAAQSSSAAPSAFIERFLQSTASSRSSPLALHPPTLLAAIAMTSKHRREHRSKSPRKHKHKHHSRSSNHKHRSRSRSRSKKHRKKEKKLPSAYAIKRPESPCRKSSVVTRSPSRSNRVIDPTDRARSLKYAESSSTRKRRHSKSPQGDERRRRSKKHRTKQSRHRSRSSSSSSSSFSSSSRVRQRVRRISDNLIDLTLNDHASESATSISSDSGSPQRTANPVVDARSSHLSEVEALIKARREQLLREDIVVLD